MSSRSVSPTCRWLLPSGILLLMLAVSSEAGGQREAELLSQEKILPVDAPFFMPQPSRPVIPGRRFDIQDFGAIPGRKNTAAIQHAIDSAAHTGGGSVVIPPGKWLTGAIHLEDNINLHLDAGAELLFSQDPKDYLPVVFSRHEDIECFKYSAFIYANGKQNIAITGSGVLNGQGKPWWTFKQSKKEVEALLYDMGRRGVPIEKRIFDGTEGKELRPAFFQPMNCTNVLVEGVTFLYGAFWTITPTYCDNVIVRRVHIVTEGEYGHAPNGDGIDPSSSRNVLIEYCEFDTGDDCIALKAGRDADGLRVGIPTENVIIRHCRGLSGHGGIVIGSETSGGVRNIFAHDCSFSGTDRIVRIKSARGRGGAIENMWFRTLSADTIQMEALHINMLYSGTRFPAEEISEQTPRVRNIHFQDVSCSYSRGCAVEVLGLPEMPAEHISFERIDIHAAGGITCTDVKDVVFTNVRISPDRWPVYRLTDGSSICVRVDAVPRDAKPFLQVDGSRSGDIAIVSPDSSDVNRFVTFGPGAPANAVRIGH